jgi:hypothetical protein
MQSHEAIVSQVPPAPPPMELRQERGYPVPLTPCQLRIWSAYEKPPKTFSFRVCATAIRLKGPLDPRCLASSIASLVHRHDALRTRFVTEQGGSRQRADIGADRCMEFVDLSGLASAIREPELERRAHEFQGEQVDLGVGPLFKAMVWKVSADEHVFFMAVDHMVADNASIDILNREVWLLYEALARGSSLHLPELPLQFADYALWQHRRYSVWKKAHDAYWLNHLGDASCIKSPVAPQPSHEAGAMHAMRRILLGRSLSAGLRSSAREAGLRVSHVVLACYALLMSQWMRRQDLIVPVVSHGRHGRPELKNVVGFLASEIYLRVIISEDESLLSLVGQVSAELVAAQHCQDPGRIPDLLPECSPELAFNWQTLDASREASQGSATRDPQIRKTPFMVKGALLPPALAPFFYDAGSDICLLVHFRSDVLAADAIDRMGANLKFIVERFTHEPGARLASWLRQLQPVLH